MLWPLQKDCVQFYGQPFKNGVADPRWEAANLVYITPPFEMRMAGEVVHHIRVHRKVADSLLRVLNAIWNEAGKDQKVIDAWGISVFSGAYNPRMMRGSNHPSMHAYGCAVDFDAGVHPMNAPEKHRWNDAVLNAFAAEGWVNLPKDHMHFQAARVSGVAAPLPPVTVHLVADKQLKPEAAKALGAAISAARQNFASGGKIAGGDARMDPPVPVHAQAKAMLPGIFQEPEKTTQGTPQQSAAASAPAGAAPVDIAAALKRNHDARIAADPVMRLFLALINFIFNRGASAPQGATS